MAKAPVLVIGHRGAPGYRPEHTRSGYLLAIAQGADAVEPDIVVSADGQLVVRHENEISGTTDVADRVGFRDRHTTRIVDGQAVTGWFAEDFTWDELASLRARERLPRLRPGSAVLDGQEPILRLRDVLDLVAAASAQQGRQIAAVVEIKHATYFAARGWDMAQLLHAELHTAGWADGAHPLVIESFEPTVLDAVRDRGVTATYVQLFEASGRPYDLVSAHGSRAPTYARMASPSRLDALAGRVDGISVDKRMLLASGRHAPARIVQDAHARGLRVFTWTCRPENVFLSRTFRTRGGDAAFGDYEGEWRMLRAAGVDGVFADHPDLAGQVFRGP